MTARNRRRILTSARCDDLARLGDGWDGNGAEAPSKAALWAAELILDGSHIEPCPDGGVRIHWGNAATVRIDRYGKVYP